jgi:transcription elongation factor/antiterminator RfaH
MSFKWYALRSKPRKEDFVWHQLLARNIECYYPQLRVNPVNPRAKKLKPYFPGYIFVNVDLEDIGISALRWMPHTLGLVSFGGEPAIVPDNLIYQVRKNVERIKDLGGELFKDLKKGDTVRIHSGPFSGYEAIFDYRLPGKERVRVLLNFLEGPRKVSVELKTSQIRKKK